MTIVLCVLLLLMAVFLTVAVLMQHGKSHNLSGTIAGGAETFFGKTKGRSLDAMLSKLTTIVAIIFVILVVVVYVLQPNEMEYIEIDGNDIENSVVADDTATENTEGDAIENGDAVVEDNGEAAVENNDAAEVTDDTVAEGTVEGTEPVTEGEADTQEQTPVAE
ncbi:MAG: preprotein translocase subunit SecG [Ruminococcaceae bacterium]|nr:preprotein translocase subunit SecG [Oscillospiraceae bacterium]